MKTRFLSIIAAAALCISGCSKSPAPKVSHVVFVGIDGFASWCLENALQDSLTELPNLRYLMENGSYSFRKRSVMPSSSAINWATIFNGMPMEMHGYNNWDSRKPVITPVETGVNGMPTTIYTLLREQRPGAESGAVYNWVGIGYLIDTLATSYHFFDYGFRHQEETGYTTKGYVAKAAEYLTTAKPALFTLYFDELDHGSGHPTGWGSPHYYKTMELLDSCIGDLIQALKGAGMWEDTIFIVSSDHGGTPDGNHGGYTLREMESPYIVCGKNIRKGHEIKTPLMQYDLTANFAYMLGLEIPVHWRGRPTLEMFK